MKFILFLSLFTCFSIQAVQIRGGGSAIVCFKANEAEMIKISKNLKQGILDQEKVETVITTDIYSSYVNQDPILSQLENEYRSLGEDKLIEDTFDFLTHFYSQYGRVLEHVNQREIDWRYTNLAIKPVGDADLSFIIPTNCKVVYVAVHEEYSGGYSKVYINKFLYSKMDITNRAALKLHEIVLKRSGDLGSGSTSRVQSIVNYLITTPIEDILPIYIDQFLIENGADFRLYKPDSIPVASGSINLYLNKEKLIKRFGVTLRVLADYRKDKFSYIFNGKAIAPNLTYDSVNPQLSGRVMHLNFSRELNNPTTIEKFKMFLSLSLRKENSNLLDYAVATSKIKINLNDYKLIEMVKGKEVNWPQID